MDLKEELTSLHTGLWGNTTNITTGDFDKNTHTHTQKKSKPYIRDDLTVLTFQDAVDCSL